MSGQGGQHQGLKGFTLLQVSIMLTVASLIMVATLPSTQTNLNAGTVTARKMDAILTALRAYEAQNGLLPCPADASMATSSGKYGMAAVHPGTGAGGMCKGGVPSANFWDTTNDIAIGMVPVRTLGLSNDYALDGWGHDITYAVDTNATTCWPARTLSGNIVITDNVYSSGGVSVGSVANSVVALISHGADGHGAWLPLQGSSGTAPRLNAGNTDTDEHLVNAHGSSGGVFPSNFSSINALVLSEEYQPSTSSGITTAFVKKPVSSLFDDIIMYKTEQWNLNELPTATPYMYLSGYPVSATYIPGQALNFAVTYSSATTVSTSGGTPELGLGIGSNTDYATYISGSGTNTLNFRYTLGLGDLSSGGITVSSGIIPNGGTVTTPITSCSFIFPPQAFTQVSPPSGVAVDNSTRCKSSKWCIDFADTFNNRIAQWSSGNTSSGVFGSFGSGASNFYYPTGVAADASGFLWVLDTYNSRIVKWTNGATPASSGNAGTSGVNIGTTSNPGQFYVPMLGIATDTTGNCGGYCVWVSDTGNNRLQRCNAQTMGSCSVFGAGTVSHPTGLAVDANNNVWVADTGNNRVLEFTGSSNYASAVVVGSSGSNNGQFSLPTGIAIDGSGNVWVVDTNNNRVQGFTTAGVYESQFGPTIASGYSMVNPTGIGVDASGNLYIPNTSGMNYSMWKTRGYVTTAPVLWSAASSGYGSSGTSSGQFNF